MTQGRTCLGLICCCGMNSCIAFNNVVLNDSHSSFTGGCSVAFCMLLNKVVNFCFIPSQLALRKM